MDARENSQSYNCRIVKEKNSEIISALEMLSFLVCETLSGYVQQAEL